VKKAVGVSPQDTAVAENLTVRENLELMAKIYGFTQEKRNERVAEMQRMFKLDEVMEQRTKTLSGGWKRRGVPPVAGLHRDGSYFGAGGAFP